VILNFLIVIFHAIFKGSKLLELQTIIINFKKERDIIH